MKNKTTPFLVTIFLCISMIASAYAVPASNFFNTQIVAIYQEPEISVIVPSTAEVLINPYRIPVTIGTEDTTAQIISTPACIKNLSQVPISVSASVVGKVKDGSDMRLVASTTQPSSGKPSTTKNAFIYFEMQAAESDDPDDVYWDETFDAKKHVIVRTTAKTLKNIARIGMAEDSDCYGAFRLTGDCVAAPKKGWTEDDGIDVEISFTFTPLPRS